MAAVVKASARQNPAGCRGSATPKASQPTATMPATDTRVTPRLAVRCAASSRPAPTGVALSRRRMPRSR
jgi:hypothetical protein